MRRCCYNRDGSLLLIKKSECCNKLYLYIIDRASTDRAAVVSINFSLDSKDKQDEHKSASVNVVYICDFRKAGVSKDVPNWSSSTFAV